MSGRYTTSNAIYQMTKLPRDQWDSFLAWLKDYEYKRLGLPEPDLVLFLDMPIEISQKLLSARYNGDESKKDIHESSAAFSGDAAKALSIRQSAGAGGSFSALTGLLRFPLRISPSE